MKQFLLSILLIFLFTAIQAQTDTAFWFAAPEVTYNGGAAHSDRPIYLRLTTLSAASTVSVSEPANVGFTTKNITIPAYSSYTFDLTSDINQIESKPPNTTLNYGLYIQSTNKITAYYEESSLNNPEMFVLKGANALGTTFFVPTQNLMDNDITKVPPAYSSFDIIATEDNTIVTITPAKDIVGHLAGVTFSVTLNKGQVYSAAAVSNLAAGHLSGSVVSSNKPIAITVKDDSIGGGGYYDCLDLAGDQIVPVGIIGSKYISIPGYLNNSPLANPPTDWVFIVATQNNTAVTINNVLETTLNAGQTYQRGVHDSTLYIDASSPIYALHLSGFSCEVGHALLPTIECTGSSIVGFTRSLSIPLFMNILVPAGGESGFSFNGNNTIITAAMFSPVLYSGGQWMYARIPVSTTDLPAGSAAIVTNSIQQFHLGVIHGDVNGCRYGYFSDFNHFIEKLSTSAPNNTLCENNPIQLICDVGDAKFVNFQWTGPNYTSNSQSPIISNVSVNNAGTYYCTASKANCSNLEDSVIVTVNQLPNTKIAVTNPICTGTTASFTSANFIAGSNDVWIDPFNNIISLNNSYNKNIKQIADSGRYILKETLLGCSSSDTVHLMVDTSPVAVILPVTSPCQSQYLALSSLPTVSGATYAWSGPNNFKSVKPIDTVFNYNNIDTGIYTLTTTSGVCTAISTVDVSIREMPVIQFNPLTAVCSNVSPFIINASETSGIQGNGVFSGNGISNIATGLFNPLLADIGSNTIYYTFNANGCIASSQQSITVNTSPSASIIPVNDPCQFQYLPLQALSTAGAVINWIGPNGFHSTKLTDTVYNYSNVDTGIYSFTAQLANCSSNAAIDVSIRPIHVIQFAALNTVCENAASFDIPASEITGIAGVGLFTGNGIINATTGLFNPKTAGSSNSTISYTYTAANGCKASQQQSIAVIPAPFVTTIPEQNIFLGNSAELQTSVTGVYNSILWSPSFSLNDATIASPVATPTTTTTYIINVFNNNGCTAKDTAIIKVLLNIKIPNAFTPNGDGKNDNWEIKDLDGINNVAASVFDRNGQKVYTSVGNKIVWDGKYNGQPVPEGTYYYIVIINDEVRKQTLTGWIYLLK